MLKTYDEIYAENGFGISKERSQWEIARELSRRNDLLEVEMLCKTAEALRNAAKGSVGSLHVDGYIWAGELACMAHKKICAITGAATAINDEGDEENDGV